MALRTLFAIDAMTQGDLNRVTGVDCGWVRDRPIAPKQ
jgi:hypothetical protein